MIVHQRTSDTGRVGRVLEEWGYALDIRCPLHGCSLPETMDEHEGAVVFGGPQSVHDHAVLPAIRAEIDWVPRACESGKPFLGICLGAQMLAFALGAKVAFHPAELHEIGYTTIRPLPSWRGMLDTPRAFYQWHKEGFDLPRGAEALATGDMFPNQAYRLDEKIYGLQFHPEVTRPIIEAWTGSSSIGMKRPEAQPADRQLADNAIHDPVVEDWARAFLAQWIGRPNEVLDRGSSSA